MIYSLNVYVFIHGIRLRWILCLSGLGTSTRDQKCSEDKKSNDFFDTALIALKDLLNEQNCSLKLPCTFKVEARRADKGFYLTSPEINAKFGEMALDNIEGLKVDIHNPDFTIEIEIRENIFITGSAQGKNPDIGMRFQISGPSFSQQSLSNP